MLLQLLAATLFTGLCLAQTPPPPPPSSPSPAAASAAPVVKNSPAPSTSASGTVARTTLGGGVAQAAAPAATASAPTAKPSASTSPRPSESKSASVGADSKAAPKGKVKKMFVTFEMEIDGKPAGKIKARLYHQWVPNTVENFVGLVEGTKPFQEDNPEKPGRTREVKRPFYDGLTFHRVIPGFMIQGGDPRGDGRGGPGYQFKDEFHPSARHSRSGMLSMANAGPNTNGSQFFITLSEQSRLDNKHSVFGEVVEGLDVAEKIAKVAREPGLDKPYKPVVMKKVTIQREF